MKMVQVGCIETRHHLQMMKFLRQTLVCCTLKICRLTVNIASDQLNAGKGAQYYKHHPLRDVVSLQIQSHEILMP